MEDPRVAELERELEKLRGERTTLATDLQQALDATRAAEQARTEFLANVSHEIRTPMNAILGMAHLTEQTELDARQRDYLNTISRAAGGLLTIINEILDVSRIEAGKLELEDVEFDLTDVLEGVVQSCGAQAEEKDLGLHLHVDDDVPRGLVGDPVRLGQVLANFVGNGVKFTEVGRILVDVSVIADDDEGLQLRFAVTDTGIGMTDEELARLFQSFSQADASKTRRYGGVGLGLVISKEVTELMGGKIEVRSAPGIGSTFTASARFMHAGSIIPRLSTAPELAALSVELSGGSALDREVYAEYLGSFGATATGGDGDDGDRTVTLAVHGVDEPKRVLIVPAADFDAVSEARAGEVDLILPRPVAPLMLWTALRELLGTLEAADDAAETPTLQDAVPVEARTHLSGARVLLAESSESDQRMTSDVLADVGVELVIAADGRRAVRLVEESWTRREPFEAVLLDTELHGVDGFSVARQLRADARNGDLPLIGLSHAESDLSTATGAGMNDLVTKPLNPGQLYRTLMTWLPPREEAAARVRAGASELELPVITGIDAKLGVARAGGNAGRYLELLRRFLDSQEGVLDLIEIVVGNGDTDLAVRLAHTLRGTAGTIGADEVFRAAGVLEAAIEHDDERWRERLRDARAAMEPVIAGLRAHMRERQAPGGGAGGAAQLDPALFETLVTQLRNFDSAARDTIQELLRAVGPAPPRELAEIQDFVETFSFAQALGRVNDLRAALGASSG